MKKSLEKKDITKELKLFVKKINTNWESSQVLYLKNSFSGHACIYRQASRSSHLRCYIRGGVLRNFSKFTGKHLCQSLFFNKIAGPLGMVVQK